MRNLRLLILLAAALSALIFSACGDDESGDGEPASAATSTEEAVEAPPEPVTITDPGEAAPEGSSKPAKPTNPAKPTGLEGEGDAIETAKQFLLETDPEAACAIATEKLLDRAYGGLGGCLKGRPPESLPDEVRIRSGAGGGTAYDFSIAVTGGVYDGQNVDVSTIYRRGGWLVDGLDADIPVGP